LTGFRLWFRKNHLHPETRLSGHDLQQIDEKIVSSQSCTNNSNKIESRNRPISFIETDIFNFSSIFDWSSTFQNLLTDILTKHFG